MTREIQTTSTIANRLRVRWAAIGAAVAVTLGAGTIATVDAVQSSGERLTYVANDPCRLMNTRPGSNQVGPRTTPLPAGSPITVDARGAEGNCTADQLPSDARALQLNVTPVNATLPTDITIWPSGPIPQASSVNPRPGEVTPNAVVATLHTDGTFQMQNKFGTIDVVIDVLGYFVDHDHDDRYAQRTGTLLLDSSAFGSRFGTDEFARSTVFGGYFTAATSFRPEAVASIPLPVGTRITAVTYHFRDGSGTGGLAFRIYTTGIDSLSQAFVSGSEAITSGAPGVSSITVEPDYVIPPDVLIGIDVGTENWENFGNALAVRAVEIDYVLPS